MTSSMPTKQTSINDLPPEMLLNIFDYLDSNSLINSIITQKKWMNLILNSKSNLFNETVLINPGNIDNVIRIDKIFKNLTIEVPEMEPGPHVTYYIKLMNFLSGLRKKITTFKLLFMEPRMLVRLCANMESLTHLTIEATKSLDDPLTDKMDANKYQIYLPNLKSLVVHNATRALRFIDENHKLEYLKVVELQNRQTSRDINGFLMFCTKIRKMEIVSNIPYFHNPDDFFFPLSSLRISLNGQQLPCARSVKLLMKHQIRTLKEISCEGFGTERIIRYILRKVPVSSLDIDISTSRDFVEFRQVNHSIKKLKIKASSVSINNLIHILLKCKEIEDLSIQINNTFLFATWLGIVSRMSHLRSLHIDSLLEVRLAPHIILDGIETLTVTKLGSDLQVHAWLQLASRCPNAKKIVVTNWGSRFVPNFNPNETTTTKVLLKKAYLRYLFTSLPHLEELEIRGKFPISVNFANNFVDLLNLTNLKKFSFEPDPDMINQLDESLKKFHDTRLKVCVLKTDIKKEEHHIDYIRNKVINPRIYPRLNADYPRYFEDDIEF
ncbi:uncharacterized protein [Chironomus tepperi]|uniref:uncharacterized protein n=1 Tax=Chironomus tepperi TaxID=113505 RepID=UPI00391F5D37